MRSVLPYESRSRRYWSPRTHSSHAICGCGGGDATCCGVPLGDGWFPLGDGWFPLGDGWLPLGDGWFPLGGCAGSGSGRCCAFACWLCSATSTAATASTRGHTRRYAIQLQLLIA